ncbi:MAG: AmmeMemoRadiSam system radical SAM enzyme [Candidatus Aenigmarchaeota archaeon]|nr:AmmeMemoRadiSam system radical SAM enzyme [Candidatus Aenigmarchaeota archaeon]
MLKRRMTRREFVKKATVAAAGVGAGIYVANSFFGARELSSTFMGTAPEKLWKWSKEGYHYIKLGNNVQCQICPNECILEEGERSRCRVKVCKNGKVYTLVYGNPCSVNMDPVEKKPLFHFLPRTGAFSIATAGCNFRCKNCQNWQISQSTPEETRNAELFPEQVVSEALRQGASSIAYTYSEPTIFYEYMYDTAKIARQSGLKNLWITNGYINHAALTDLCQYLDGANVDLKGFRESVYNDLNAGRLQPVLETLKTLKEKGVWFEITNLIVPTYTDDLGIIREMCRWLVQNIGRDYPIHFSRFNPLHKLKTLPQTPVKTIEEARKIAVEEGIKYAYVGNVPNHKWESTFCPKCQKKVIARTGYLIKENNLQNGKCKFCGENIAGVWG